MKQRRIFLDVGAYTGDTALAVLNYKNKFDEIYCFEPSPIFWKKLKSIKGITVNEFGLWKETCVRKLYDPIGVGASLYEDKFRHQVTSKEAKFVKASSWINENIKTNDEVYLKLNCEGAECDILEDLFDSGEYKKISVLMIDFDVRKVPSQRHRENEIRNKLKEYKIPAVFTVEKEDFHRWRGRNADFTNYWLDITTNKLADSNNMNALDYIVKKYNVNLRRPSPIEIPDMGRNNLAELFAELGFKTGVEVGVLSGEYSEILAKALPSAKLYGIDPYIRYTGYGDYRTSGLIKSEIDARTRLAPYIGYEFIKKFSMDAVKDFDDNSIDFVYIDGNHDAVHVKQDIELWSRKVKNGGIVSGHDYFIHSRNKSRIQVYQAVRAYAEEWRINPWFVIGSKAMLPGQIRDKRRSWMWVKI